MNAVMEKFLNNTDYDTYYVVFENSSGEPLTDKLRMLDSNPRFLRFEADLQSFGKRNRNRRLWLADHVRTILGLPPVPELITRAKGAPGEAGHPIGMSAPASLERVVSIDPERVSHYVTKFYWPSDNLLSGVIETAYDPGGPGTKLRMMIEQGKVPAWSLRAIVPQRKNPDGSIDVLSGQGGRFVAYDRVYVPSHEEAYMKTGIPVKDIVSKSNFEVIMESFAADIINISEKAKRTMGDIAMDAMVAVNADGTISANTNEGRIVFAPEKKYQRDIRSFMRTL